LTDKTPVGWAQARQILRESGAYDAVYRTVFGRGLPLEATARGRAIQALEVHLSEKPLDEISQILNPRAN
jgi:hypothetical protein